MNVFVAQAFMTTMQMNNAKIVIILGLLFFYFYNI